MTLREQLLSELRLQDEIDQKEIKELEHVSITENSLALDVHINGLKSRNNWIHEMLDTYN